ncbi:hypothetical protein D6C81_09767 [Aureobasidium pullulans]|uniref:Uncharacterized protein n=1 Tax=Aureobasidium pullulans TaxID=5580 RepID=A0A4S8YL15_AURPU|nr:hypothetical protein D6D20_09608 [Aureobasidium pullulans]TIA06758.1 hypothetical protein D6C81_09767 [Aureobasidium pullulans]
MHKRTYLSISTVVLASLLCFATGTQPHALLNQNSGTQAESRISRFPIEDLSPSEWRAEHERTRASLGDEAYLALRLSEIDQKMRSSNDVLNDMIKAGQWNLPPVGNDVKPDRIGFGDGRVFDVGIKHGVPDYITDAMYATYGLEAGARSIPEEWLEFEVPAKKLKEERKRKEKERQEGLEMEKTRILDGSYSVRDIDMGCFLNLKSS